MKFISIWLVDPKKMTEEPTQEQIDRMGALIGDFMGRGVLVDTGGVMGTAPGFRVRSAGGAITVTDGPFSEAKEVVGGYAILNVSSRDEAVDLIKQFVDLAGDGVCELHQLGEM